jgi:hypothetical protein
MAPSEPLISKENVSRHHQQPALGPEIRSIGSRQGSGVRVLWRPGWTHLPADSTYQPLPALTSSHTLRAQSLKASPA